MKNKLFLASMAVTQLIPTIAVPAQAAEINSEVLSFNDVGTSHYAYTEITNLAKMGVVKGFTDGTFLPTKQVTRAEFASFVARSLELPAAESNFKDVSKSMALYDGISRASKAGIILGFKDGTFKSNTPVSREDMAVILDRAMQVKGKYTQSKALTYADKNSIGAYAQESVKRMNYYNIMGAHSGTNFSGKAIGNRAETAKSIYNMLAAIDGVKIEEPKPVEPVDPTPPKGNYSNGDVVEMNGFKFTYNGGFWITEMGNAHGKVVNGLPVQDKDFFNRKAGSRIPIAGLANTQAERDRTAYLSVFMFGLDINKNELIDIMTKVSNTKQPVTTKGLRFEIDPNYPKTSTTQLRAVIL